MRPVSVRSAEAYERRYESLLDVTLPEGTLDLALNVPGEELRLLAVVSNLAIHPDLHPSLQDLLLDVATTVHTPRTLFTPRGTFPSPEHVSLPLSAAAERFYEEGPSSLRRIFPYWLASWLDRMFIILAAILTLVVAVLKIIPPLLSAKFSATLNKFYRRLEGIEKSLGGPDEDIKTSLSKLDELEAESARTPVLLGPQRPMFFEFRQNLHDVRARLEERGR